MASSTLSTSSLLSARAPAVACRKNTSRSARAVRVFASQDKQTQNQAGALKGVAVQAPKDAILKTFGAIAAAQLAFSGAALADLIPESAKSGSARADVNERTSSLPSFGDVGRSLQKNFGTNDPKDIGKAIDENTPNAPDLTKNPKDIGKDIVGGAKNLVGDLSLGLPNPRTAAQDLKQGAKQLGNKADKLGNDVGSAASNLSGNPAQQAINKAKSVGSDVKKAGNQAVSNLSDLSDLNPFKSPGGEADKLPVPTAGDVKNAADKAGANLPNLPNPFKGDGGDIAKQLDKAPVPTASDVQDLGSKAKDAAGGLGGFQIPKNS